jgi:hypothetical protein
MNPILAVAMMIWGSALLATAALGYLLRWFPLPLAVALGVLAAVVDAAGAILFIRSRRSEGRRRPSAR